MEFGLAIFPTEDSPPPGELARRAEEAGFDAFHVTEHTHIPAGRETPYPAGGELPREYSRIYDPLISLTQAAAMTVVVAEAGAEAAPARDRGRQREDRVIAFGEGWIPNYLGDVEKLAARTEKLHRLAAEAERDAPQVAVYGSPRDPAAIHRFAEAGVKRCVFWLPPTIPGDLDERFAKCAKTVSDYA